MKKLLLFTAACCMTGVFAHAQTTLGAPEHLVVEAEDNVDSSATIGMKLPTQKGTAFLGASLLLAEIGSKDLNTDQVMHYNVGVSPRYGYFVANNFALGVDLNANIDGYTKVSVYTINAGIGVFARCYTGKAADKKGSVNKLRFFVEGGVGYDYLFDRYNGGTPASTDLSDEFSVLRLHLMPGLNYFANRNVAFEFGLNYSYQHTIVNEDKHPDDYNNIALSVGLQFFFGKK